VFVALLLAVLVLQLRGGHPGLAATQLLLGLVMLRGLAADLLLVGADPPESLVPCDAGLIELRYRSGRRRRVRPSASTLVWSSSLLLVLEGEDGPRHRLLLGPGNVPASQFAALRREWVRPQTGLSGPLA
jgi:hypothetical protein